MYGDRRPEFNPDQFMKNLQDGWDNFRSKIPGGGNMGALIVLGLVAIAVIWGATGFYIVQPGQQATVRLFGEFRGVEGEGLKWYFPSPIGTVRTEDVAEIRSLEVGFRLQPERRGIPDEAHMITGDLNIVNIEVVVQYRIQDLYDYTFRVADPGDPDRGVDSNRPDGWTLRESTEAALRQVVGQRSIDSVLTEDREGVQRETQEMLQGLLDDYNTGILVTEVNLQDIRPPEEVRPAFDDVVSARLDQEARINQARAYEQDQLPRARGDAEQIIQAAEAFREARIAEARGESAQFVSIFDEYQHSPDVTRQRLFLESMEEVLPRASLFVLDSNNGASGNGVLPLLPLSPMNPTTGTPGGN